MTTIITNLSRQQRIEFGLDDNQVFEIVDIVTLVSDSASITEITAKVQNDLIKVTGTSRRSPGDKPNEKIGEMLSVARAHASLARTVERRARGLVEHYADMVEQRPLQREKSMQWTRNIIKVASNDDRVQREAVRRQRISEGSWEQEPTGRAVQQGHVVTKRGPRDCS